MDDNELKKLKEVEFYSVTLSNWYTTRIELDKHLLSLSSLGIALLVTLITTVGISNIKSMIAYGVASLSFLVTIFVVLEIFKQNAEYLSAVINDEEPKSIKILDDIAKKSFLIGIAFMLLGAIFSSLDSFNEMEVMSDDKKYVVSPNEPGEVKSVDGAGTLKPANSESDSTETEEEK